VQGYGKLNLPPGFSAAGFPVNLLGSSEEHPELQLCTCEPCKVPPPPVQRLITVD